MWLILLIINVNDCWQQSICLFSSILRTQHNKQIEGWISFHFVKETTKSNRMIHSLIVIIYCLYRKEKWDETKWQQTRCSLSHDVYNKYCLEEASAVVTNDWGQLYGLNNNKTTRTTTAIVSNLPWISTYSVSVLCLDSCLISRREGLSVLWYISGRLKFSWCVDMWGHDRVIV